MVTAAEARRQTRATIARRQVQRRIPTPTPIQKQLTQTELQKQQIETNRPQIQALEKNVADIERALRQREAVGDITTIRFFNAEKGAINQILTSLKQGLIVAPSEVTRFVQRSKQLTAFKPTQQQLRTAIPSQERARARFAIKDRGVQVGTLAERQGIRPIIVNGEIFGFEDIKKQQDVPLETAIKVFGAERLKKAGFIITDAPQRFIEKTFIPVTPQKFKKNEKLISKAFKKLGLERLLATEPQTDVLQLVNKVFDEAGGRLFSVAEKAPFRKQIADLLGEKFPITKFPVRKGVGEEVVTDFLKFIFFAPAFETAVFTKQFGKGRFQLLTEELEKEGGKFNLDKIADDLLLRPNKSPKTKVEKLDDIEKIFEGIAKTKDPKLRAKQIKSARKFLDAVHGEASSEALIKDFIAQRGLLNIKNVLKQTKLKVRVDIEIPSVPRLKGVGEISGVTISPTRQRNIERVQRARDLSQTRFSIVQTNNEIQKERNKLKVMIGQKQLPRLIQQQRNKITALQRTRQRTIQRTRQALTTKQAFKTQQVTAQRTIGGNPRLLKPKIAKKPKKFFIPLPFGVKPKKKVKKKKIIKKNVGHNVFVKRKGKFKKVNINPLTKAKARDLGAFLTDKSVARTFKTKQSGTLAQKPKLKVPSSYFKKNIKKFRGRKVKGKVQPIKRVAIEKRKFGIDSRGEKQGLSFARVKADLQRKLGLKKPIKRRKKK